jgi:UDP-N-acetylmuramate--alanine ligase
MKKNTAPWERIMSDGVMRVDWEDLRVHFVAIGGIGMSALARLAHARGSTVSGCDGADSPTLGALRRAGIPCHVGHSPDHLSDVDLVVYSTAVPLDSPEMRAASERGVMAIRRGEMLAWLTQGHPTVAISGTHGKTTTTWIVSNMLMQCGADPTVAVGGRIEALDGNWRMGEGPLFVTEADESDRSFLYLTPQYPVITNIDLDHVEHYGGIEDIKNAFVEFAAPRDGGAIIACLDCPNVQQVLNRVEGRVITYGIGQGDVAAEKVQLQPGRAIFDARLPSGTVRDIILSLPGIHNVKNALAALALAEELGLRMDDVLVALADTCGVDRRLQRRGTACGIAVYDDYAHHPAEIAATLESARELADGRLIGIFQPHRYSRTLHLQREFGPAFNRLDLLLIAPIYAASEPPIPGVSSALIAREVEAQGSVSWELLSSLEDAPARLENELAPGDLVVTLGAGNVWEVGDAVLKNLERRQRRTKASMHEGEEA